MKILLTVSLCLFAAAAMAQTVVTPVNIGTTPNDGTGDPLRTAMQKLNANEANLNGGKLEVTNPVVHGTLTGDNFGQLTIGDQLNFGSIGSVVGFAHIITGPTHSWFTLEITPGASGGAPGTPSSVIIHSPLSASQLNAPSFADASGYEWQHADGSFDFNKPGNTNIFSGRRFDLYGAFTDSSNYKRGSLYFTNGDFYIDDNGAGTGGGGSLGNFVLNAGASHSLQIHFGGTSVLNAYYNFDTNRFATLTLWDGLLDLGGSDRRWRNVYASNFFGQFNGNFIGSGSLTDVNVSGNLYLSGSGSMLTLYGNGASAGTIKLDTVTLPDVLTFRHSVDGPMLSIDDGNFQIRAESGWRFAGSGASLTSLPASQLTGSGAFVGTFTGILNAASNTANTIYYPTVGGATSWGAGTLYTNGPQGSVFRMDISSTSGGSGSPNQVFFHYTNNAVGRLRQAFFTLASSAVNVQSMNVELDPGATFRIDTITSTGGSFTFLNQTISSR